MQDQFRLPSAIEDARSGGGGRVFALHRGLEAFFHQLPPRPGDGRKAGVQRRSDPAITPGLPGWRGVHLQQDARLRQLLRRVLAAVDQALQLFTLVRTELHNVLLYGDFPRDHEPAPTFIAKPSILTIYSLSMTQGTSSIGVRITGWCPPCHGRPYPGHPRLAVLERAKSWVAGPSPAMTR